MLLLEKQQLQFYQEPLFSREVERRCPIHVSPLYTLEMNLIHNLLVMPWLQGVAGSWQII